MKYIIIEYCNNHAGCDEQEYLKIPDTLDKKIINDYCSKRLVEYAKSYEPIISQSIDENKKKNYYNNCTFSWYEINPADDPFFDENEWTIMDKTSFL